MITRFSPPGSAGIRAGFRQTIVLASFMMLGACASVPKGDSPPAGGLGPLSAAGSLVANMSSGGPSGTWAWPGDGWWRHYGDDQLNHLIEEGLAHSPNVAAAAARLRKAGAMARAANAALLPSLDINGTAGGTKMSYNQGYPQEFVAMLPHGWNSEGELTANFGFDPDIWGQKRAMLSAAISERRAAAIDAYAARIALACAITDAYVGLGGDAAIYNERQAALANREATERLITQRYAQGLETRAGVAAAKAATATARGDLAAAQNAISQRRDALAALLGEEPDRGIFIVPPYFSTPVIGDLPLEVTSELLGRRADIAAARERAEAAAARIRSARASFYPAISLSALIGYQSLGLSQLLASTSTMGTVGPAISLPIFHGGELRANYRGARADYDVAVADYNGTVVAAYQQLADAVTARAQLARQREQAAAAAAATEDAWHITKARYEGGLSPYLDVLASEDRWLAARSAFIMLDTALRQADVALIRALGGGYATSSATPAVSQGTTP